MEPGFVTAMVDDYSGGIFGYSQAGAGAKLLIVMQQMSVAIGKGLQHAISEESDLGATFFTMSTLVVTNLTSVMAEFAASPARAICFRFRVTPPCQPALCDSLVVRGTYTSVEKIFLVASELYAI